MSKSDGFCLDGNPLIAVSGDYGGDGTEYRTQKDTYAKIVSQGQNQGAPAAFVVYLRNGLVSTYGGTAASRFATQAGPLFYAISSSVDRHGNRIDYEYQRRGDEFLATEIQYGGNLAAGHRHYRKLVLHYEAAQSPRTTVEATVPVERRSRLKRLSVETEGRTVWQYELSYATDALPAADLLMSVRKCDGSGNCLGETRFKYKNQFDFQASSTRIVTRDFTFGTGWTPKNSMRVIVDINNDGYSDFVGIKENDRLVYVAAGGKSGTGPIASHEVDLNITGSSQMSWEAQRDFTHFADINGDGHMDLVVFMPSMNKVALGHALGFGVSTVLPDDLLPQWDAGRDQIQLADVTCDGLPDIVALLRDGVWVAENLGDRWQRAVKQLDAFRSIDFVPARHVRAVLDLNRDQCADVIGIFDQGVYTSFGAPSGFQNRPPVKLTDEFAGWSNASFPRLFRDVNDDGYVDLVGYQSDGIRVALGTGTHFLPMQLWLADFDFPDWRVGRDVRAVTDVNEDGIADFIGFQHGTLSVVLGTGAPITTPRKFSGSMPSGEDWLLRRHPVSLADIGGDGAQDLTLFLDGSVQSVENRSMGPLLAEIVDGYEARIGIDWAPASDPDVHEPGLNPSFPVISFRGSKYLVAKVETDQGAGGRARTSYTYHGGQFHLTGAGFLGFDRRVSLDHETNLETEEQYSQDWRNGTEGLPTRTVLRRRADQRWISLSDTALTWESRKSDQHPSLVQIFNKLKVTTYWSPEGELLSGIETAKTVDERGNVLRETVATRSGGEEHRTEIENKYSDNVVRWLIGQLTASVRTKTLPGGTSMQRSASFTYDPQTGVLLREATQPGTLDERSVSYSRRGNPLGLISRIDRSWTKRDGSLSFDSVSEILEHDERGRLIRFVNALGHERRILEFDDRFDAATRSMDENGQSFEATYDAWGQRVESQSSDGQFSRLSLQWCSTATCPPKAVFVVTKQVGGRPITKTFFDSAEQVLRMSREGMDGRFIHQDRRYDASRMLVTQTQPSIEGDPVYWSTFVYDQVGRLVKEILPDGTSRTTRYEGHSIVVTNARGAETRKERNALGQTIRTVDAMQGVTRYDYDANGSLVRVVDPLGDATTLGYDPYGARVSIHETARGMESTTYNGMGLPSSIRHENGRLTEYAYDKLGRPVSRLIRQTGQVDMITEWVWDRAPHGIGRIASVSTNGYSETFQYDALSRSSSIIYDFDGEKYTTTVKYDYFSRIAEKAYPSGLTVTNFYDAHGYIIGIAGPSAATTWWRAEARDSSGKVTRESLANGVVTLREIDPRTARLSAIRATLGERPILDIQYRRNDVGRIEGRNHSFSSTSETFKYDVLDHLVESRVGANISPVAYDANGNILAVGGQRFGYGEPCGSNDHNSSSAKLSSVTTDDGNRAPICYDEYGNVIRIGDLSLAYSSSDRPVQVKRGLDEIRYQFGPDGQPIAKLESVGGVVYRTKQIGDDVVAILRDGTMEFHHLLTGGVIVTKSAGRTAVRFIHPDAIGSPLAITDEVGTVIATYRYGPWGETTVQPVGTGDAPSASGWPGVTGFAGHPQVGLGGLVLMGARLYSPTLARFLSVDPLVTRPYVPQGLNRYAYVLNDPLGSIDPTGYFSIVEALESIVDGLVGLWQRNDHILVPVIAVVAASYTGGVAGNGILAAYGTSAATVAAGTTASVVSGIAAGAAAGATAGAVSTALYGGTIGEILRSAALGGVGGAVGGGVAGYLGHDLVGRTLGGGLNGFMQTGDLSGAGRGMVAGMVPENLWMDAYYSGKLANITIGIAREAARGFVIDGAAGVKRSVAHYAILNGMAHALGHVMSEDQIEFDKKRGLWIYNTESMIDKADALTIGNVVLFNRTAMQQNSGRWPGYEAWLWNHEATHANMQSALGMAYLPTHIGSQWIVGEAMGGEPFMEYGFWMGGRGYETHP